MSQKVKKRERRILISVTGLSPQVLTETLYALTVTRAVPWIPDEIHLLTTREGKQRAELALLSEEPGWFDRLCRDYDLPSIHFDAQRIHAVADAEGNPLDDIRTPEDNERLADQITEMVRSLTADESTALHVSIAGGRKTMGFYLGYAISLFGRPQDRLSHVLVSEPFESSWDFFYPTPYSKVITTRDNKLADTRDARIELAEIPFVSLRDSLPARLRSGKVGFSGAVEAARKALEPPSLVLDLSEGVVVAAGECFGLADADFGFYAWFAHRRANGLPPLRWTDDVEVDQFLAFYETRCGRGSQRLDALADVLKNGIDKDWFNQRRSKTNRAILDALGESLAQSYLIHSHGQRPDTRYGLSLPEESIRFEGLKGSNHE